jgi:hypothetical protein
MSRVILMKYIPVLIIISFALSPITTSSGQDNYATSGRFSVSSLDSPFALVGVFEGEFHVYPDRVEVLVEKAALQFNNKVRHKRKIEVSSIRVGLAKLTSRGGDWEITTRSEKTKVGQVIMPGQGYELVGIKFTIKQGASIDLSKRWLVFEMEEKGQSRYAYAHSNPKIFSKR